MVDYEKNIAEEAEKGIEKCFNNEGDSRMSQIFFGVREELRGVVVKEWVAVPNERIDFSQHN